MDWQMLTNAMSPSNFTSGGQLNISVTYALYAYFCWSFHMDIAYVLLNAQIYYRNKIKFNQKGRFLRN